MCNKERKIDTMRILLPYHLGCGNRGCEGIARGISKILDLKKEQLIETTGKRIGLLNITKLRTEIMDHKYI